MRPSRLDETLGALGLVVVMLFALSPAQAAPLEEPSPEPLYRVLRDDGNPASDRGDYVKTWYIFNDDVTDGILNPGDTMIGTFKNWWTPVSAHTQHNYLQRTDSLSQDWSSAPLNYASQTDPAKNYWMERNENELAFYLSYSQYDNNAWKDGGYTDGKTGKVLEIIKDRNANRSGYVIGWLTHDIDNSKDKTTTVGDVKMDMFIHKGKMDIAVGGNWGGATSYSNPQVAVSNDIDNVAKDMVGSTGQWHPPQFDEAGQAYLYGGSNQTRMEENGHGPAEFVTLVNSMEVKEHDPSDPTWATQAVDPTKTPDQIFLNEVDDTGAAYIYEDSFRDRGVVHEGASDGGVIAGLSGFDNYDPAVNNWGDQQVIRIDLDDFRPRAEVSQLINKIVFWDFGDSTPGAPGTQQTAPVPITFYIDRSRTVAQGQIYHAPDPNNPATWTYFPDNRIYIARVNIPEPAALLFCVFGGVGLVLKRRRRRSRA